VWVSSFGQNGASAPVSLTAPGRSGKRKRAANDV